MGKFSRERDVTAEFVTLENFNGQCFFDSFECCISLNVISEIWILF